MIYTLTWTASIRLSHDGDDVSSSFWHEIAGNTMGNVGETMCADRRRVLIVVGESHASSSLA